MKAKTNTASRSKVKGSAAEIMSTPDRHDQKQVLEPLHEYQAIVATAEEVANLGSWKWDLHTKKITWSEGMFSLFGVEQESFDGDVDRIIAERIHPDDVAAVNDANRSVLEDGVSRPLTYRIVLPSGTERTVWAQGKLIYDENGKPRFLSGYVQDISERVRAENRILQLKRLYATLSQVNQVIVRVKDRLELFQSICDVAVKYGEFSPAWIGVVEEASGKVLPVAANGLAVEQWEHPIVNTRQGPYQNVLITEAVNTSQVVTSEDIQTDERTSSLHSHIQGFPIHSLAVVPFRLRGRTHGVLILISQQKGLFKDGEEINLLEEMSLDISFALDTIENESEHRQAEKALQESENKYRDLVETSKDGIFINREGRIVFINQRGLEMLGATRHDQILGHSPFETFHPDFHPLIQERIRQLLIEQVPVATVEEKIVTLDGKIIPVEVTAARVTVDGVSSVQVILRDITERKQAEEKLRQSEERYRLISENTADVIWVLDPLAGRFKYISPSVQKLRGYTPAEIMQQPLTDALTPESFQLITRLLAERLPAFIQRGSGTDSFITEVDQPCKDGSIIQTEVTTTAMFNQQGMVEIIGVSRDITERRQTEQVLRENEERLRLSLQAANQGLYDLNVQTGDAVVNRQYAEMLGYEYETFVETNELWIERLHPDDRESVARAYSDYVSGLRPDYRIEFRQKTRDGSWKWILSLGRVIKYDEAGRPLRMLGTHTDITERKQAEEILRESEARFSKIFQSSPTGINIFRLADGRSVNVNEAFLDIVDYSREELLGRTAHEFNLFVDPEARNAWMKKLKQGGSIHNQDTKIRRKSGETRDVLASLDLIELNGEKMVMVIASDITDRKRAEEELHASEERYRNLVENMNDIVMEVDADGNYCYLSPNYASISEYSPEEELGSPALKHIHPDDLPMVLQKLEQTFHSERESATYRVLRKNGEWRWLETVGKPYRSSDGSMHLITVARDISERKQAEEALKHNEQVLRLFVEHTPASVAMFDRDMRYIVASRRYLADYRLEEQDLTGRCHYDVFPEMPESWKEIHRRCLEGGIEKAEEDPFPRLDGRLDWVRWEIRPWYEETDKIGGIILFSEVITDRKLAEKAIRDTNEKLAHAQAMAHIGSWEHDLTTDRLHWSEEMYRIMGFPVGIPISLDEVLCVFPTDELAKFRKAIQTALYEHAPYSVDYYIVRPDRTRRDIHDEGEVTWDEQGNPVWMNGTTQDITARKRVEKELQALNINLEQRVMERTMELSYANRAKDEFLANMSHELRTPLNAILGLSESLLEQRRGPLNTRQVQSIELIASSGKHLLSLINDILDVSKIEAGKLQIHADVISVKELCQSSLSFIKELALKKSITVEFICDESINTLRADPQRLKQILINLLNNAVKFTPQKGQVRLDVSTNPERNWILFSVTDTGIGIAAEDLKKLFIPFTQLDSSLARQYAGTGLGLSLVQKLAVAHGGSVQVESEVGKGSRFTVILPLNQDLEGKITGEASEQLIATDQDPAPDRPGRGIVVLLAEDNQVNSNMMSIYLESYGYTVLVAQNGEEVLQKVEQITPHIIVMDIQMPKMDGLETTQRLRNDPRFAATPIVALTALVMPGDRERCFEAGVNEYLSKPVSLKTLVGLVENLTGPKI